MKTIIVVTNKDNEIKWFSAWMFTNAMARVKNGDKEIIVVDNTTGKDTVAALQTCDSITNPKILLYHGDFTGYNGTIIRVGSDGHKVDRQKYELFARNGDKLLVFDDVWDYFSTKYEQDQIQRNTTDFLYSIYKGTVPQLPVGVIANDLAHTLIEHFTFNPYDKNLDFVDDENEGRDQRDKLTQLRKALLTNS
jgi:hypothetical protein